MGGSGEKEVILLSHLKKTEAGISVRAVSIAQIIATEFADAILNFD